MSPTAPSGKKWSWARFRQNIYLHLVEPFLETHDPLPQVAWGAAVGLFVGLTPTVGIQMYIVTLLWLACRYGFRVRFNLTIAISMVWISNPFTMVPLYYLFLETGDILLGALGYPVADMTFDLFRTQVARVTAGQQDWLHWLLAAGQVLIVEFGWPMVVGSLVYAVPGSIFAYPFTYAALKRYRRYLADQQGLSYQEWRARYEARN